MMKKLFIRADGNDKIGLGHIMRSMTIADEFRTHGFDCIFLSSQPINREIFDRYNFQFIELPYPYNHKSVDEAIEIVGILDFYNADYILIDSYFISNEYLSIIKNQFKVICINSTNDWLNTDYLINENIACDINYYKQLYLKSGTKLILGSTYSPIRREFVGAKYIVNPIVKNLLVTTGGGDQHNFMTSFLRMIKRETFFYNINITFVSGLCNPYLNELLRDAFGFKNVSIVSNAPNMAELMKNSDIAISAGGTTVLELSAIGVPTLGIAVAKDQEAGLLFMGNAGIIKYIGKITNPNLMDNVVSCIYSMLENYEERKKLSDISRKIIDGLGAERIYNQIENKQT